MNKKTETKSLGLKPEIAKAEPRTRKRVYKGVPRGPRKPIQQYLEDYDMWSDEEGPKESYVEVSVYGPSEVSGLPVVQERLDSIREKYVRNPSLGMLKEVQLHVHPVPGHPGPTGWAVLEPREGRLIVYILFINVPSKCPDCKTLTDPRLCTCCKRFVCPHDMDPKGLSLCKPCLSKGVCCCCKDLDVLQSKNLGQPGFACASCKRPCCKSHTKGNLCLPCFVNKDKPK